jgi:acyl transferase domain-containing protein/NAD(P)H-dependent flavin oxidoreductase YrpB (nitropropane dioxygenase family)
MPDDVATATSRRDLVIGISPFGRPNARLVAALGQAGALGVLDLGSGDRHARTELMLAARWSPAGLGLRIPVGCALSPADAVGIVQRAGGAVELLVLERDSQVAEVTGGTRALVEVTGLAEADRAARAGATGLLARGAEAGGRVGELGSYVLLQQLLAAPGLGLPVWLLGGIGPHTAAAAVLGGAAGVVLDTQLALLAESDLPAATAATLRALDGSETVVAGGHRVLAPRGPRAGQFDPMLAEAEVVARLGLVEDADPGGRLLPVGQDGFLAGWFADRYGSAPRAVHALRDAIRSAVDGAPSGVDGPVPVAPAGGPGPVLAPGGRLAAALGTRLPVVQGPMTRVSDQPEFAAAVAAAGALPMLALALSTGEQTRDLLARTGALLGDSPWGVGILGFVPEEVRDAQLAEIQAAGPAVAVIAGGRPNQAANLEAAGIATFLHVPSPRLLEQYLAAGVRRFVFEGSECGGHVGPRASFPLWEAQTAVLLDHLSESGAAGEVQVLYAGGVHDARSAAMVAALAAPLADRGAAVGVLMGTAYLFTAEAVEHGAVRPGFQREVLAAERTELLQTAPGHATRCVRSPYVQAFVAARAQLRRDGRPDREIWEELERLNVGRLRVASKGVERVGGELAAVEEGRQHAEGLFMAGQVALLRSAVTTVAALHASVTDGAASFLAGRQAQLRTELGPERAAVQPRAPLDVAIVGMACVFPGAADLPAYWANIVAGVDAVTEVPTDRWDVATYFRDPADDGPHETPQTPSRWGGFLPPTPFDPLRYGIPPSSLASIEPVQLLALEVARRALEDAGYGDGGFDRSRTSVVFGAEAGSDLSNAVVLRTVLPGYLGDVPAPLSGQLPALSEDSFPGMLANVISGRIANRLDLGGANFTVDAACASALAALDVGCAELVDGSADLVLCGGADMHNGINDFLLFSSTHALSPTGRCRPFDATADGITLGEGVACVVLKRLADAERDGDRVYAVVAGIGAASDGRGLGLTAPRPEGQRAALERAYRNAHLSPADVSLVEAHGTGTVAGDRTELSTLGAVFTAAGATPGGCALGSVKSQIGHTKCAAGLAGLVKTAMALHTGVQPPTLHLSEPNSAWDADRSPFAFGTAARPWPRPPAERVAGVSAFGFGGTNFHAVLRGHAGPAPRHGLDQWPAELFLFRGDGATVGAAVADLSHRLADNAAAGSPRRLRDFARTAAAVADRQAGQPARTAIVASTVDDLAVLLRRAAAGEHDPVAGLFQPGEAADGPGQVAFLFPGQGSQRVGMLAELFVTFGELSDLLALGPAEAAATYPPAAFDPERASAQATVLRDTRVAQPALGIAGLAVHQLLDRLDIRPDLLGGHSYGELVALAAAGAFEPATLVALSRARAAATLAAAGDDPGTMTAVAAGADEVAAVLRAAGLDDRVVVANRNAPRQVVIAGPTEPVGAAVAALRAAGHASTPLPVGCAFHRPALAAGATDFARTLADVPVRAPELPVFSNRSAAPYPTDPAAVRAELAAQLAAPVRFADQVEAMYAAGARTFVEVGPGSVLSGLVAATLGDRPHLSVPCSDGGVHGTGLRGFLAAVARLAVAGVPVRTGWLYAGRDAVDCVDQPLPKPAGWTVDGQLVRTAAGEPLPGGLAPARRVQGVRMEPDRPAGPPTPGQAGPPAEPAGDRAELIGEFLRTSRDLVLAQRDVLLSYFGAPAGTPAGVLPAAGPVPAYRPPPTYQPAGSTTSGPVSDERSGLAGQSGAAGAAGTAGAPTILDSGPAGPVDMLATILAAVSERTGYPVEMVEPDLDLEAELSIDSIKRTEILGELAGRLGYGLTEIADTDLEELAQARTARAMADRLATLGAGTGPVAPVSVRSGPATVPSGLVVVPNGRPAAAAGLSAVAGRPAAGLATPAGPAGLTAVAGPAAGGMAAIADLAAVRAGGLAGTAAAVRSDAAAAEAATGAAMGVMPGRFLLDPVELPPCGSPLDLRGRTFVLVGRGPVTDTLGARLVGAGALVSVDSAAGLAGTAPVDGVLFLDQDGAEPTEEPVLPASFPAFQAALRHGPQWLIAAVPAAQTSVSALPPLCRPRTAGLRGFFRTVAKEYPDTAATLVEVGAGTSPGELASLLLAELRSGSGHPVVRYRDGRRYGFVLTERGLGPLGIAGAGPANDGAAEARALGLDRESVLLLVGGARGITATVAAAFAAAAGCRIELVGRTAAPEATEHPATAAAPDRAGLRRALAALGHRSPTEVDQLAARILAQREVRATLAELRALGSPVRYHVADARNPHALRQVVKEIVAEHGRVDGIVYAAGVIADRLLADQDTASFRRVFATKVDGAYAVLDALRELPGPPRFAVLFGSIAAVLGNRGQSDYAAANDALETLGADWAARTGNRALTVHWGPWAPRAGHAGMVSAELVADYGRRGVALIDPDEGALSLLRELAWGDPAVRAVTYTAARW